MSEYLAQCRISVAYQTLTLKLPSYSFNRNAADEADEAKAGIHEKRISGRFPPHGINIAAPQKYDPSVTIMIRFREANLDLKRSDYALPYVK